MSYSRKFDQIKATLYANHLAYDKTQAAKGAFVDHYNQLDENDPRRQFVDIAIDLSLTINELTEQYKSGTITDRFAYLSLLAKCSGQEFVTSGESTGHRDEIAKQGIFVKEVETLLGGPAFKKLITDEEKQFAFLCINAVSMLPQDVVNGALLGLQSGQETLAQVNWLIANKLYEQYKKIEKTNYATQKKKIEGILASYLRGKDRADEWEMVQFARVILPLEISDYLFYQMSDKAVHTLLNDMLALHHRHLPAEDKNRVAIPMLQSTVMQMPAADYDNQMRDAVTPFVQEINLHYRKLNDGEKSKVTLFVQGVNALDENVREMQAIQALITHMREHPQTGMNKELRHLQEQVSAKRARIIEQADFLKFEASRFFDQGKPSSTLLKVLGIGLMVLGIALLAASIAWPFLFLLPAVTLFTISGGVAITSTIAASVGFGVGGVFSFGLGGLSLFKSREITPAKVTTTANKLITLCEQKGLEACDAIEKLDASEEAEKFSGVSALFV